MTNETTYEKLEIGIIEVHYCENVTKENQAIFLTDLHSYIDKDPILHKGIELLIDMSKTKNFSAEAQILAENFVKEVKIIRVATYGASEEIKNIREGFYTRAGKSDLTHYFTEREQALSWLIAERIANAHPTTSYDQKTGNLVEQEWSTMYVSPDGYIEMIYPEHVDFENQNRILSQFEDYMISHPPLPIGADVLIDMTKTTSFSDGAQMRTKETLDSVPAHKVAIFGADENLITVRKELYKVAHKEDIPKYFKTRAEALEWLKIP